MKNRYILTLSCADVAGIVASVATFLKENGGFILESAQFGDESTGKFFMRVNFEADSKAPPFEKFKTLFLDKIATPFKMDWKLTDTAKKPKVILMVSKQGHCLNDILHRYSTGYLPIEIPAVVSNHEDLKHMADWYKIPFIYLPVDAKNKEKQEQELLKIIEKEKTDLLVLARYMQILSGSVCEKMRGKAINIHHSFLPSFKGAKPYHQAYARGVKLIGATAHFVTTDLDEGPIIDQEATRVEHTHKPEDLIAMGQDAECIVLTRSIKYFIEQRVLLNGNKTVIFK